MAKFPMQGVISIIRRSYSVGENVRVQQSAAMRKVSDSGDMVGGSTTEKTQCFWMRDPKTGNWIPENHFGDVDVAEQREKLLSKKYRR